MKKIIALIALTLLFAKPSIAQSDYSLSWSTYGVAKVQEIQVDLDQGTRFWTAHGAIVGTTGTSIPITGTCIVTNKLECSFFTGFSYLGLLSVSGSELSGIWYTVNSAGQILDEGQLYLK